MGNSFILSHLKTIKSYYLSIIHAMTWLWTPLHWKDTLCANEALWLFTVFKICLLFSTFEIFMTELRKCQMKFIFHYSLIFIADTAWPSFNCKWHFLLSSTLRDILFSFKKFKNKSLYEIDLVLWIYECSSFRLPLLMTDSQV